MHLMRVSHRRTSHERASLWASLVGLSRGSLSRACICIRLKVCVPCLRPRACVLCLRPRACVPYPRPRTSVPCPCPYPRASALQAHTVYPGPLCCFSRAQPAEASQGWKRGDSHSLASRATWIQLWVSCHGQSCIDPTRRLRTEIHCN
jgi:hypothetical protein